MAFRIFATVMVILQLFFGCGADQTCESRLSAVQEALLGNNQTLSLGDRCSACQGRDGKRGGVGPPGPAGVPGPKGEPGECKCNLDVIKELQTQLRALEEFRKKVSEYGNICYVGISTGAIPISHVTATSTHPTCEFKDISLNSRGAWCAETNDDSQYVQVDLQRPTAIYGVLTRGRRNCCSQWVTAYKVSYGNRPSRRLPFYREKGSAKLFKGNTDSSTIVKNEFERAIIARYIRVHPIRYNIHMSMNMELLRC